MKNTVLKFLTLGAALCGMSAWAGIAKIGEVEYATLNAALAAVEDGGVISLLADSGTPESVQAIANLSGKTITILGSASNESKPELVVGDGVKYSSDGYCDYRFWGANVNFRNLTIKQYSGNANYQGFAHVGTLLFDQCVFKGRGSYWGNNCTIQNSVFEQSEAYDYCLWTWGCANMVIKGCTFNTQGKAIKMYGAGTCSLTVEDCQFYSNGQHSGADKPAIAINTLEYPTDYTLVLKNCTQEGFVAGATGSALYGSDQASEVSGNLDVIVDTVQVWKDGKSYTSATGVAASQNILAVKRVPGISGAAAGTEVVAAVPWRNVAVTGDVTVDRLVATGVATGDEIAAWMDGAKTYYTWRWNGTAWEPATDAKTGVPAPAASATTLRRGTAVWYKRANPSSAYSQVGGYDPATVTTAVTQGGATSEKKPANTLLINPYDEAVDLTKILGASGDQIQTLADKKVYTYKDGKWGTMQLVEMDSPFGPVKKQKFVPATGAVVVPAGQGFWYISKGGAPAIDWKAIKAGAQEPAPAS